MLSDAIYNILSNAAGVTALVGTDIYPGAAPQGVNFPFVVYSTSSDPTNQKDVVSPIDVNSVSEVCYAKTYRSAHLIAAAIRTALDNYSGTAASVVIRLAWFTSESDADFIEDHGFFVIDQSYQIKVQR